MGRCKNNHCKSGLFLLILLFTLPLQGAQYHTIDHLITPFQVDSFKKLIYQNDREIFLHINSSGGEVNAIFKILETMELGQQRGYRFYGIVEPGDIALAGSFFPLLFCDYVFYSDPVSLGASARLLKQYSDHQAEFTALFNQLEKRNGISAKKLKYFFRNGEYFDPVRISSVKNKYIKISQLEDITYTIPSYQPQKLSTSSFSSFLSPNVIFMIVNLTTLLLLTSTYLFRNWLAHLFTLVTLILLFYATTILPINPTALILIFIVHILLVFKPFLKLKYLINMFSLSLFLITSITIISPNTGQFYIEINNAASLLLILGTFFMLLLIYRVIFYLMYPRLTSFFNQQNDLLTREGKITALNPLTIKLSGDHFIVTSNNHLMIGDPVKVIDFQNFKPIVQRID